MVSSAPAVRRRTQRCRRVCTQRSGFTKNGVHSGSARLPYCSSALASVPSQTEIRPSLGFMVLDDAQVRRSRLLLQQAGRLLQWPEAMLTALSGMHAGADQQTSLPRCTVAVRMETEHAAFASCVPNHVAHTLKRA